MVRKRDGRLVPFHREKIAEAIFRAAQSIGGEDRFLAEELAGVVSASLAARTKGGSARSGSAARRQAPTIEDVQDAVERVLMEAGHARTAKAYILYRDRRATARSARGVAEREAQAVPLPVVGDPAPAVSPLAPAALISADLAEVPDVESAPATPAVPEGSPQATAPELAERVEDAEPESSTSAGIAGRTPPLPGLLETGSQDSGPQDSGPQDSGPQDSGPREQGVRETGAEERGHAAAAGPATGIPARGDPILGGWTKARIAAVLERDDGLTRVEAEDVARTVEARILSSRVAHVSETLVRSLITAEMFTRGELTRLAEDQMAGVPHAALERALAEGLTDRRAGNPAAFAEGVGETVVARHVMDRVLPPESAAAHRAGDIHVYDMGAPLRLSAISLDAVRIAERGLAGAAFASRSGARRVIAALEDAVLQFAPHASRSLSLENVNVLLAPFVARMDEEALAETLRHLLLGPVLRWANGGAVGSRGGLMRLELGLTDVVPLVHRDRPVPEPVPTGQTYGDFEESAHRVTRALLTELAALSHEGHDVQAGLTLRLERGRQRDAQRRALETDALRTASLVGEPLVVLDEAGRPSRGSRWLRLTERDSADPLRFDQGDVSAAGAVAVNLVGAALRTRGAGVQDFLREVERHIKAALDASRARHDLLGRAAEDPGGTLYGIACGHHPLIDLESAHHLVDIVGLEQAVVLLSRRGGTRARQALRRRLVLHLGRRVSHEAAARRLCATVVEGVSSESAVRFAMIDRERYPETVRWWGDGEVPTYHPPLSTGLRREGAGLDLYGEPGAEGSERPLLRVQHRVDGEATVSLEVLRAAFEEAVEDPAVVQYRLEPWPRRFVRTARGRHSDTR